jgi:molybdenum cofactor guanylyltransferase
MNSAIAVERITGLVLAGGRGRRMGSIEKGLQLFRGYSLITHVLARLVPQVGPVLINANRYAEIYKELGHPVVGDLIGGLPGPLAGLHAGLAACKTDYLVAVPCDAPFLPLDLVARFSEACADDAIDVVIAMTAVRAYPVFCMMKRTVAPSLVAYMQGGGRTVQAWVACINGVAVSFGDDGAFRNLNTLDELRKAEGHA